MIAKMIAGQIQSTTNPDTRLSVSNTINTVITNPTKPKVKKLMGKLSTRNNHPIVALTKDSTSPATIATQNHPVISTPGVIRAATANKIPPIRTFNKNFIRINLIL